MLDPSTVRLIQTEAIQLLEISVLLLLLNISLHIAYKPFHEALQPESECRAPYFRTQRCISRTGTVFKGTYIVDGFDNLKILHGFVPLGPEPADLRLDAVPDALGAGGQDPVAPVPAAGRSETKRAARPATPRQDGGGEPHRGIGGSAGGAPGVLTGCQRTPRRVSKKAKPRPAGREAFSRRAGPAPRPEPAAPSPLTVLRLPRQPPGSRR